jgi:hypothetical protein
VAPVVEVVQLGDERAHAPGAAQLVDLLGEQKRLVCDVEADHGHLDPAREDPVRRFWIGPDVELSAGRDVALGDRTAHQDYPCDPALDPRVLGEQEPDVRQRPDGDEDDSVVVLDLRGDEVGRVALARFRLRVRQVGTVEAGIAVNVGGGPLLADERPRSADVHRHVRPLDELQDLQRVGGRLPESLVARDRGDPEDIELGRGQCQQERDRVVVPWIGIEDELGHRRWSMASTSPNVGSEGWAPCREAASAPAAHARSRAS